MTLTEVQLNRLAQYLYEEITDCPNITISMPMTGKAELVGALEIALERLDK